jgi:hypothetical protein
MLENQKISLSFFGIFGGLSGYMWMCLVGWMVGVYCFEIRIFEKKMKTIYGYIMDYNTDHESDYESDYESVFDFSVKKCGICLNALNDFYNREHFMCTTCDESLEDAL